MVGMNECFISKLRAASPEELRKSRSKSLLWGRTCMVFALGFMVLAIAFGMMDARNGMSLAFAAAVLQVVGMMSMQIKVWFIDLILSEKMPAVS